MTTIGKIWTAGIAYVALAVGAGLSIMYNVVDTMSVRGAQFDIYDLVTAVAAPGIVVLMVEMFVSRWWIGRPWYMQIIRATSCAVIGGIAMRASWTHGHDFMSSRGQTSDVATTWPLAIDLLAIMATALILAGRGQLAIVATGQAVAKRGHGLRGIFGHDGQLATATANLVDTVATGQRYGHEDRPSDHDGHGQVATMATSAGHGQVARWTDDGHGHEVVDCPDVAMANEDVAMATQPLSEEYAATLAAELEAWDAGTEQAITDAGPELATETEQRLRPAPGIVPEQASTMISTWDPTVITKKELDELVAEKCSVSLRTARRWRSIVTGSPTSGGR